MKVGFLAIGFLILMAVVPVGIDYGVYQQIKRKVPFETSGKFSPGLFQTSFHINQASFQWKNRVKLLPGDLKVSYGLSSIFKKEVRIKFEGKDLDIELLGDWQKMQGQSEISLTTFYADLGISDGEVKELYGIEALGPQFRFSIQPSN